MIFEVSVILGIYRGAVVVEFYCIFCIYKHKFYRTVGLGLRRIRYIKFYFAKIVNWQCSRKFRAYQLKFCHLLKC